MERDLDPQALRTFLAVADTGSFTRAAPRVHRSQAAVSMQIKKLEQALNADLFDRDGKTVRLTAQGETLIGHARRILEQQDIALAAIKELALEGLVRIGVMDDYATHILPPLFARFERRFPQIQLEVTTGMTADLMKDLGSAFDMVLATQPAGAGTGTVLRREETCWAYAAGRPLPAEGILPLAMLKSGNLFRRWATEALDHANRPWRIVYTSSSISAMEAAAAAGIAVTVVKRSTVGPGLRLIDRDEGLPALPFSEISLHRVLGASSPAVNRLAAHLEEELAVAGPAG